MGQNPINTPAVCSHIPPSLERNTKTDLHEPQHVTPPQRPSILNPDPVRVNLTYQTAFVDEPQAATRNDVYGRDAAIDPPSLVTVHGRI